MSFLTIKVNAKPTVAPTVSIATISDIKLPVSQVTATCTPQDSDGTIVSIVWSKVSGGVALINNPTQASTTISNLSQGNYTFKVTVTDNDGLTAQATVSFTVNAANVNPTVEAGINQSVIRIVQDGNISNDVVSLQGTASDSDGSIISTVWSKQSGPDCSITTPNSLATTVTGLLDGIYIFQILATDNEGGTASDTVQIEVKTKPNLTAVQFTAGSCCSNYTEPDPPDPILQINSSFPVRGSGTLDFRNGQPGELLQLRFAVLLSQGSGDEIIEDEELDIGIGDIQGIVFGDPVVVESLDVLHTVRIGSVILNSDGSATSRYNFIGSPTQACIVDILDRSSNLDVPAESSTSIIYDE